MARHSFFNEFKGDESAGDSGLFLCQKCLASDKCALLETHSPFRIGFDRRRVFIHIVAIEQIAHLQPQEIPRAESRRFNPKARPLSISLSQRRPTLSARYRTRNRILRYSRFCASKQGRSPIVASQV